MEKEIEVLLRTEKSLKEALLCGPELKVSERYLEAIDTALLQIQLRLERLKALSKFV